MVPTSTWSCGECNSHLNPGATQVKDQPLACNNCQKIFHKRCTNRKGVKGIGWNKTPRFCPACLASNISEVGNSTISDSLQLASPSPSSLASISQPTNSRLASTSLPQGSSSITTLSTARQNPVTSVPPDDATETVPLTRDKDDPRNTDQPQRFPSNAIRQRKSNIAVLEPEKEFQKATIDACRSTITQQEAELKRLKESLDIRNGKIMQLESQVGLATSHLSRRDECPKDSNSRTVTDQLSATLSSLNLLLSKLTLWSDPPVSRASPVNVYNTHCNHNRPYQVDRCTQTQTIMNISSTTPDASTVAVEVSDTMDATDNEDSHDDTEIIFTCTLCNKDLKSSQQLDRHVENVHNNQATQPPAPVNNLESSIECEYCGETFPAQCSFIFTSPQSMPPITFLVTDVSSDSTAKLSLTHTWGLVMDKYPTSAQKLHNKAGIHHLHQPYDYLWSPSTWKASKETDTIFCSFFVNSNQQSSSSRSYEFPFATRTFFVNCTQNTPSKYQPQTCFLTRKTCLVNQDMCGMVLLLGGEMISMPMSVLLRALVTVSRGWNCHWMRTLYYFCPTMHPLPARTVTSLTQFAAYQNSCFSISSLATRSWSVPTPTAPASPPWEGRWPGTTSARDITWPTTGHLSHPSTTTMVNQSPLLICLLHPPTSQLLKFASIVL